MLDAFTLYWPNVIATVLTAISLFLFGSYYVARGQALQTLVLGQATSLGLTFGFLVELFLWGSVASVLWISPLTSLLLTALVFWRMQKHRQASGQKMTPGLITLFLVLLALNYVLTSLSPSLEPHFSNAFLGDLATASSAGAYELMALSLFSILFWFLVRKRLLRESFEEFALGLKVCPHWVFLVLSLFLFSESIRHFGFLFTLTSFCVPAFFASLFVCSQRGYFKFGASVATFGTLLGFLFSLGMGTMPTTAAVVLGNCLVALFGAILIKCSAR
jgi:ABC-type Mn2+/Zn2+ transport system permease subunit